MGEQVQFPKREKFMRIGGILLLTLSFILGAVAAISVRLSFLDAKPVETVDKGPTVKILITSRDIAGGAEISADAVFFEEVPVAELPEKALTNFGGLHKHRAAFPIPAGYPVCSDFLRDENQTGAENFGFLPAGSQVVSLEVEQLRNGDTVAELSEPITNYLTAGQRIDIRAVPEEKQQGIYVQRKNQLLRAYMPKQNTDEGEVVLDNIEVLRVLSRQADTANIRQVQSLALLLKEEDAARLNSAAKNSRLRVALCPLSVPAVAEETPVIEEKTEEALQEQADVLPAQTEQEVVKNEEPAPQPATVIDFTVSAEQNTETVKAEAAKEEEPELPVPQRTEPEKSSRLTFKKLADEPASAETEPPVAESVQVVKIQSNPSIVTVGAVGTETHKKNTAGYSPFGLQSRQSR
ncbi:MAG: hypothetical protein LBN39_01865 [Planctomycetaceae bacterium]|jgi:Flp pilus assembly protein CpaB|nr:hypothetical protein [Planctomycetaceae bacterium]